MNPFKSGSQGSKIRYIFTVLILASSLFSALVIQAAPTGMNTAVKLSLITTANDVIPPSVPQQLSSKAKRSGFGEVLVSWKPSSDNIKVSAYRIYRNGHFLTSVTADKAASYIDPEVVAGQSYEYRISAVDSRGNESSYSIPATANVQFDNNLLVPSEGGSGKDFNDGASWTYYNKGARLKWQNAGGDFIDANGVAQGSEPWAVQTIIDTDSTKEVIWNVTRLVQSWADKQYLNRGFHIRRVSGSTGNIVYATKEAFDSSQSPFMRVKTLNSGEFIFYPQGDTHLNRTTTTITFGQDENILTRKDFNLLIWFDLATLEGKEIVAAELQLTTVKQYTNTEAVDGIFAITTDQWDTSPPVRGLSDLYPNDSGISGHPDVYLHYSFDTNDVQDGGEYFIDTPSIRHSDNFWSCDALSPVGKQADGSLSTPQIGIPDYKRLNNGNALCLRIKYENGPPNTQGLGNYGVGLKQYVRDFTTTEQTDELFVRFYIFLSSTWGENTIHQNGKRPGGISGLQANYSYAAGWGGRTTNGANGWSARGAYLQQAPYGFNLFAGFTPIGTYLYHADQSGGYGDILNWDMSPNSLLGKGRWYCIEQQLVMNTRDGANIKGKSGANDGILRGWVDGRLMYERTDIRFTDMDYINIDAADFGLYYGGVRNTPYDQHMAIDNIVIAKSYIGPMKVQ